MTTLNTLYAGGGFIGGMAFLFAVEWFLGWLERGDAAKCSHGERAVRGTGETP